MSNPVVCWGLEWSSESERHGVRRWIVMGDRVPVLFHTRKAARAYQQEAYGHTALWGWQVPRVVKIVCTVKEKRA